MLPGESFQGGLSLLQFLLLTSHLFSQHFVLFGHLIELQRLFNGRDQIVGLDWFADKSIDLGLVDRVDQTTEIRRTAQYQSHGIRVKSFAMHEKLHSIHTRHTIDG